MGKDGRRDAIRDGGILFRTVVENAHEAILVVQDGVPKFVNQQTTSILGFSEEELLCRPFMDFVHPEDRGMVADNYKRGLEGEDLPSVYPCRVITKGGHTIWVEIRSVRTLWDGRPAMLNFLSDAADRVWTEEGPGRPAGRFRSSFRLYPDALFLFDPSGEFVDLSSTAERLTGYRKEELVGKELWSAGLLPPEQAKEAVLIWEKVRQSETVGPERLTIIRKDGGRVGVEGWAYRAKMDDQEVFIGIARDLTERREWEARFEGLFHGSPLAIAMLDRDGRILEINQAFERLFQYEAEEARGSFIRDLIEPLDRREEGQRNEEVVLSGSVVRMESQRMRKDGTLVDVSITGYPIRFGREIQGIYAIYEDITERKKGQQALERAQRRYKELVEQVAAGIYEVDVESGKFLAVNDFMCKLFGYNREEFLSLNPSDLLDKRGKELLERRRDRILRGLPVADEVEYSARTRDGRELWVRLKVRVGRDAQGRMVSRVVATDVSEQKRLEAQFLQAQRMEAVGRLAGGVAHDINNALTSVLGYADMILSSVEGGDPIYEAASEIKEGALRASRTIQQLLAFSRKQIIQPQVLDLNVVVQRMQRMLVSLIGEDIRLEVRLGSMEPMIFADRGQMEQVLMNLAVNARDAMPEGGRLIIETADVELDEEYGRAHGVELEAGPYVMLAVSDTGVGMDEETRRQVFEPFFTTKEVGKGTGLGLSTVYGIVKQNRGYIWVYSEPGKGSTFKIYLPRAEKAILQAGEQERTSPSPRGEAETVLVVEDDEAVMRLVKDSLERMGYSVLAASDPQGALALVRLHSGPIHLLLADVVLPGISGKTLAEMILARRPETKVLYMSGYTQNAIAQYGVLEEDVNFIQKPFTPSELAQKVREVLDK